MRAQHVIGVQFFAAFQCIHARAQIGEFPRRAVHHRQRQARAEDFVFDGVVVHQAEPAAVGRRGQVNGAHGRDHAAAQPAAQHRGHALQPDGRGLLQVHHQIAPLHRQRGLGGLARKQFGASIDGLHHRLQTVE
jgi:hypothetical protein